MAEKKMAGAGLLQYEMPARDSECRTYGMVRGSKSPEPARGAVFRSLEDRAKELQQIVEAAGLQLPWGPTSRHWARRSKRPERNSVSATTFFRLSSDNPLRTKLLELGKQSLNWTSRILALREDSIEFLAVQWLHHFDRLQFHRSQVDLGYADEQTTEGLIKHAMNLEKYDQLIWWRTKPVPGTETTNSNGKSAEQLALERLPSRVALVERNEGRDEENTLRAEEAARWRAEAQALADPHWRNEPSLLKAEVAGKVRPQLQAAWETEEQKAAAAGEPYRKRRLPSANLIARAIKKPS